MALGGDRDGRLLPDVRVRRRHPRLPVHPGPARHRAARRCRLPCSPRARGPAHPGPRRAHRGRSRGRDPAPRVQAVSGLPRLSRSALAATGRPTVTPPARIVHLGVGAFHRAHQAWYTARAADAAQWGIVAFTGRSSAVAERLQPQDGLYTLIERGPAGDRYERVDSLVQVWPGEQVQRLAAAIAAPETALITLTITEAGYRLTPDGRPDLADPVLAADVERLRRVLARPDLGGPDLRAPDLG